MVEVSSAPSNPYGATNRARAIRGVGIQNEVGSASAAPPTSQNKRGNMKGTCYYATCASCSALSLGASIALINGIQIKISMMRNTTSAMAMLIPPESMPVMTTGMLNGRMPTHFATIPRDYSAYIPMTLTRGVTINGIAATGFSTMGRPKIIGSLMPKKPGASATLPTVRS